MKTKYEIVTSLAFSAVLLVAFATMPTARAQMNTNGAEVITNGPQANPHDNSGPVVDTPELTRQPTV